MFYNGNVKIEPGAVVCRVSPSFVRFGTFQLPVSRGGMQVRHPLQDVSDCALAFQVEDAEAVRWHDCVSVARCWIRKPGNYSFGAAAIGLQHGCAACHPAL
jgi:hypothetical protein